MPPSGSLGFFLQNCSINREVPFPSIVLPINPIWEQNLMMDPFALFLGGRLAVTISLPASATCRKWDLMGDAPPLTFQSPAEPLRGALAASCQGGRMVATGDGSGTFLLEGLCSLTFPLYLSMIWLPSILQKFSRTGCFSWWSSVPAFLVFFSPYVCMDIIGI